MPTGEFSFSVDPLRTTVQGDDKASAPRLLACEAERSYRSWV
jgi:hypothetical protein